MKVSYPFLATRVEQLQRPGVWGNDAVEGVLFKGADLRGDAWQAAWANIAQAVALYGASNVTFHFPVDDADYAEDPEILRLATEALQRATDLGLHGMVIHSNRIRLIPMWGALKLADERRRVLDALGDMRGRVRGATWLALENMPVMDNWGVEIDPLFVFPGDFVDVASAGLGIVWDFCHYSNSLANMNALFAGEQQEAWYPNRRAAAHQDFVQLGAHIVHWHFSAFRGVANPGTGATCREGVLPGEGDVAEEVYAAAYRAMHALDRDGRSRHVVYEVQEPDYTQRAEAARQLAWALHTLGGAR